MLGGNHSAHEMISNLGSPPPNESLIEMASKWEALRLIPLVYRKTLECHKRVARFQATSLSVTLHRPSQICDDGQMGAGPVQSIEYSILPRRLRVLCP